MPGQRNCRVIISITGSKVIKESAATEKKFSKV